MPLPPGTILCKTDLGRREVASRTEGLTGVQRRLLILVDGKRSLNDLGAFVRVGELDAGLQCLLERGLVAPEGEPVELLPPVAAGFSATAPGELERPATSLQAFAEVRQSAADFVRQRLGDAGEPLCDAITRCGSPQELRKVLRGIELFIGQRLDAERAQSFARHFGALLL